MTLEILFSLKTVESLENRLQTNSGATPLFSMRTVLLASSQSCRSVDADAWCKQALKYKVTVICGFYVYAFVGSYILIIYISYFSRCVFSRVNSSFGFAFISRTFDLKMKSPSNAFVRENLLKAVTLSNTSYVALPFKTNQVCALVVITVRKRSLGQGNIFAPVCHSVHGGYLRPPGTRYTPPGPGTPPQYQAHPPGPGTPRDQVHPPGPGTPPRAEHAVRYSQHAARGRYASYWNAILFLKGLVICMAECSEFKDTNITEIITLLQTRHPTKENLVNY